MPAERTLAEALSFAEECQRGSGPWCRHAEALLEAVRTHVRRHRFRPEELPPVNSAGPYRCFIDDAPSRSGETIRIGDLVPNTLSRADDRDPANGGAYADFCFRNALGTMRHSSVLDGEIGERTGPQPGPRLGQPDEIEGCE